MNMKIYFTGFVLSIVTTFLGLGHVAVSIQKTGVLINEFHIIGLISGFLLTLIFFVALCMNVD